MECLRLRIKDLEFAQHLIVVRDGKGENDRVTVLPEIAHESLLSQITAAKQLHSDGAGIAGSQRRVNDNDLYSRNESAGRERP